MWNNMGRFEQDGLIRLAGVDPESVVDGPGLRGVVFFQGCIHHCPGCHNPETWSFEGGALKTPDQVWQMLHYNPLLTGITISGGEPLLQSGAALVLAEKDRKSTRLNSSHVRISYAVFCLKKKKNKTSICEATINALSDTLTVNLKLPASRGVPLSTPLSFASVRIL